LPRLLALRSTGQTSRTSALFPLTGTSHTEIHNNCALVNALGYARMVQARTRLMNQLQAVALKEGIR